MIEDSQTAEWVFNIVFQSSILVGAGWLLTKICKKSPAPLRSGISLSTLVILILVPLGILLFKSNDTSLFKFSGPSLHLKESQTYYAPPLMENEEAGTGTLMTASAKTGLVGKDGHAQENNNKKFWSINTAI